MPEAHEQFNSGEVVSELPTIKSGNLICFGCGSSIFKTAYCVDDAFFCRLCFFKMNTARLEQSILPTLPEDQVFDSVYCGACNTIQHVLRRDRNHPLNCGKCFHPLPPREEIVLLRSIRLSAWIFLSIVLISILIGLIIALTSMNSHSYY